MTVNWNIEIWDKESVGILKRPFIFIQVEATVRGFYDTGNHLGKKLLWDIGEGYVYWGW